MRWPKSLGLCLLVLSVAGCGAAGRASLPVESGPDAASTRAAEGHDNSGDSLESASVLPGSGVTQLTGIHVAQTHTVTGGVKVEIAASSPVNYTSYQPEPEKFILEIPNVDLAKMPAELSMADAGMEPVKISSLPSHGGGSHARIEFTGRSAIDARVIPEGTNLAIYMEHAQADTEAAVETPATDEVKVASLAPQPGAALPRPVEAAPAKAAPAIGPVGTAEPIEQKSAPREEATTVTGVVIEGTGADASIAIIGDGEFSHNEFTLKNPDRLVVDLIGVVNRVPEKTFQVSADPLQQVRVAQFKTQPRKVVRIVFDLTKQTEHLVVADADGLRVLLGRNAVAAETHEAAEPAVRAASMPAAAMAAPVVRAETVAPQPAILEPRPSATRPETPSAADPAQGRTAAQAATTLPEIPEKLVPTGPKDLSKDIVLFDKSDPGQAGGDTPVVGAGNLAFQSQTIAGERRRYRGEKISVTFRDADVREVFFFFADVMKMNVVLDPDVTGRIDIRLTQVPWDQAFQVILKNQGLDAVEEESVVRIAKTQKLRAEAAERRALKQAQEQEVDPVTFTRKLSYAKVAETLTVLQQVKTERGKIIADTRTNTIIISDIPDKKAAYDNLLNALDSQTPQVSIEARIVEAIRSFERSLGIDWGFAAKADPALGTQTNFQFPHRADFNADVNLSSAKNAGTLGIALGNVLDSVTLDVQLDAFESDGKVRILSAPKVVTQNNQPATIEQGVQIPVVTTTATQIEVQYVPASLRLIVTPQITAEQTVIMKVLVENNQPSATVSVAGTPGIVTERVDTQILVRTGTTAVIGGVYKLQETDNEAGVPGLHRIPFFGWLFKNKNFKKDSSELIVFLTPKIVTNV